MSDTDGNAMARASPTHATVSAPAGAVRSRPPRNGQTVDHVSGRRTLPPVSVSMSVFGTAGLSPEIGAHLEHSVTTVLRTHGVEVAEPARFGREPPVRIEGTVALSDAGTVAETGLKSSNASVALRAIERATGMVIGASRGRSPGAGIDQGDARDRATLRALEEATEGLVADLSREWYERQAKRGAVLLNVRNVESLAQVVSISRVLENDFLQTEEVIEHEVNLDAGVAVLEWRGSSSAPTLGRWISEREFTSYGIAVVGIEAATIRLEIRMP